MKTINGGGRSLLLICQQIIPAHLIQNNKVLNMAFLREQCKEIEENNRMERLEISSRKLEIPREHFMQRWAQLSTEMTWT